MIPEILLREMVFSEYKDEVLDSIRQEFPKAEISDVFYDVTLTDKNVLIDVKG